MYVLRANGSDVEPALVQLAVSSVRLMRETPSWCHMIPIGPCSVNLWIGRDFCWHRDRGHQCLEQMRPLYVYAESSSRRTRRRRRPQPPSSKFHPLDVVLALLPSKRGFYLSSVVSQALWCCVFSARCMQPPRLLPPKTVNARCHVEPNRLFGAGRVWVGCWKASAR